MRSLTILALALLLAQGPAVRIPGPGGQSQAAAAPWASLRQPVCQHQTFSTSVNCALTSATVAGDALVLHVLEFQGVTTVTVSGCSTTWTKVKGADLNGGTDYSEWDTGTATSSGACTVTVSYTGTSNTNELNVWNFNTAIAGTVDGNPADIYNATSGTNLNGPTVTTTNSNTAILADVFPLGGSYTCAYMTPNSPFSLDACASPGAYTVSHYIRPTAGSTTYVVPNTGGAVVVMGALGIR
jgi:hypothetical protein